jgi:hypothetical protein
MIVLILLTDITDLVVRGLLVVLNLFFDSYILSIYKH